MKPLINFHQHSIGSDGKLNPEEIAEEATKLGLKYICFTDHYPLPRQVRDWGQDYHSEEYYREVLSLTKKYAGVINIGYGGEFDWLEDFSDYTKEEIKRRRFDYVLGSIHFLKTKGGEWVPIDDKPETFRQLAEDFGGVESLVRAYYGQLRLLVQSGLFDSVGHLDYIKNLNVGSCFFSEEENWYRHEVKRTLEAVRKQGICIEINGSGLRKEIGVQYPSIWILREALRLGIPITLGNDFHSLKHGNYAVNLQQVHDLAKEVGYLVVNVFEGRKRKEVALI